MDFAWSVSALQSGRLRLTALLERGLQWETDQALEATRAQMQFYSADRPAPALVVSPRGSGGTGSRYLRLNSEHRITIPRPDRDFMGAGHGGVQCVTMMRLSEPTRVLILSAAAASLLFAEALGDAL